MQEFANIIGNYGIGFACVIYLIYFQFTTMKEMTATLQETTKSLEVINVRLSTIEDKLK